MFFRIFSYHAGYNVKKPLLLDTRLALLFLLAETSKADSGIEETIRMIGSSNTTCLLALHIRTLYYNKTVRILIYICYMHEEEISVTHIGFMTSDNLRTLWLVRSIHRY